MRYQVAPPTIPGTSLIDTRAFVTHFERMHDQLIDYLICARNTEITAVADFMRSGELSRSHRIPYILDMASNSKVRRAEGITS